jgi:hypothetical protein
MSRAVFTFTDQSDNRTVDVVEFDLIDNVGCRAWQYAVMLNNPSRYLHRRSPINLYKKRPANIADRYETLKSIIEKLSTTEFAWHHRIPESFDQVDQDFMNLAHRHFTTSCFSLWNPSIARLADRDYLDRVLHDLNSIVHDLELYVPTANKLKYHQTGREICLANDGRELGYDILPFKQYHSYDPADLIMDGYILGKTLLESFACHDNPTSWDTTGHIRTNGGAHILLDNTRQQIYESVEFLEWLQSHNLEKHMAFPDFPLGHFVPGHQSRMESLYKDLDKYSAQVHIQL